MTDPPPINGKPPINHEDHMDTIDALALQSGHPTALDRPFIQHISARVLAESDHLDERLRPLLHSGWQWARLPPLVMTILRIGACEIDLGRTPTTIVIDQYVSLAKVFCDTKETAMVNAVLQHYADRVAGRDRKN